jgi:hypothetical protein
MRPEESVERHSAIQALSEPRADLMLDAELIAVESEIAPRRIFLVSLGGGGRGEHV